MDSWSEIQLKKMESGGNDALNHFLSQYGIPKATDIAVKYNTNAASVYRDRIQALAEGRQWRDPPVVKEEVSSVGSGSKRPPIGKNAPKNRDMGWDSWDMVEECRATDIRKNKSVADFRRGGGGGGRGPVRSCSTEDIYTRSQLEASATNKDSFFARKLAENDARPEGLPPSQGGKFVGFGSSPSQPIHRSSSQGDVLSVFSQGFGRLSSVAASAAQSAANVVQAGTKELTSKVKEGGYDSKVNETVSAVTNKTSEIGQRTWGIMKGVVAMTSIKVEEFAKEGSVWSGDDWKHKENERDGSNQEFGHESKSVNTAEYPSTRGHSPKDSGSWDDWNENDQKEPSGRRTQSGESWGGWDDTKDDGYYNYPHGSSNKNNTQSGRSGGSYWTDNGFH